MQSPAVTTRRELDRRIIKLAIPALGTLAIEPIYVLVDTAIVGRLGTPQLGGLAIATTILLTVISLTASLEYGITPDVAFAHGAGRADDARAAATAALRLALMIGVPLGVIVAVLANPLAWLLGGRGDVLEYAVTYLRISCVGLPFVLITYVGHGVMRGVNKLTKPLQIVVIANVAGRDLVGFVEEAKRRIADNVKLPEGYRVTWGGQFENQQRAAARLSLVIPLALCLIFIILFTTFHSVRQALARRIDGTE